jgi:FtsP/CotA-like multicopper oxidase with cupredoxin domain
VLIVNSANGITECPIPGNGTSKTYRFICNEFGTTWYHSHYTAQYGDGVLGTIIINGPASANYDLDLGTFPITDWYYKSMWEEVQAVDANGGAPPPADNLLINGKNKNPAGTTGEYDVQTLTPGKKHRLRIINTSVENMFYISLDSHTMQVIQADFVPIVPFNTTSLFVGIGQRYDVIIDASETPGNYWFRVDISSCSANMNPSFKSIFNYEGITLADPTSTATDLPTGLPCLDESSSNLVPFVPKAVDKTQFNFDVILIFSFIYPSHLHLRL